MPLKYVKIDQDTEYILIHKSHMFYSEQQTEKNLIGNVHCIKNISVVDLFMFKTTKSGSRQMFST